MFICKDCGELFEVPAKDTEFGEAWGSPFSRQQECCPRCGGYFEEAAKCPICGEVYLEDGDDVICGKCFEEASEDIETIVRFYEETDEMNVLIAELNEYAPSDFATFISRALLGRQIASKTKINLAQAWAQNSGNVSDFKEWLAEKALKGEL